MRLSSEIRIIKRRNAFKFEFEIIRNDLVCDFRVESIWFDDVALCLTKSKEVLEDLGVSFNLEDVKYITDDKK